MGRGSGIHGLVARQHGIVARRQLLEAGWNTRVIDKAIARGDLLPVHAGVYAVGHRAIGDQGRWMAAVLAGGREAVLSGRSAGALHGLLARDTGITHITAPVAVQRARIVGHRARLHAADRTVRRRIPVTTIARTLVDLDHQIDDDEAYESVVRETMFHGLFHTAAVADALTRRSARRLASYLDDQTPTQTRIENRFLRICRRHRIPPPLTQQGEAPRVDFLWPAHRLVVEVDGWQAHRTKIAFQKDRSTTNQLQLDGYLVLRFTWEDVTRRPAIVAAQIRQALGLG
jgi:very-short-patch-repair endonuclease